MYVQYVLKEVGSKHRRLIMLSKAFDHISHGKLCIKLHVHGSPSYLIRILHFCYSHQTIQARWGKSIS